VHLLRGLAGPDETGQYYADLAQAVLAAIYPVVVEQFALRHGPPPGRGAAVLGMGSLGASRLHARSDLDVIVIYDPDDLENSDGKKPLPVRQYYARLTQALITAMTAPMSQGRLYEMDMRLRPSGNQGPVAASWNSFRQYQQDEAWVWEHLALTRALPVAGADAVAQDVEAFRRSLLSESDAEEVRKALADMRDRIAAAKPVGGVWDAKTGAGRMQDVELVAQAGALLSGSGARDVQGGLAGGVAVGWLHDADAQALGAAYDLYWAVIVATRLVSETQLTPKDLSTGTVAFLCRATGFDHVDDLQAALEAAYEDIDRRITALLGERTEDGAP